MKHRHMTAAQLALRVKRRPAAISRDLAGGLSAAKIGGVREMAAAVRYSLLKGNSLFCCRRGLLPFFNLNKFIGFYFFRKWIMRCVLNGDVCVFIRVVSHCSIRRRAAFDIISDRFSVRIVVYRSVLTEMYYYLSYRKDAHTTLSAS